MDFEPKTRKEYYMAIIAGGTPGEDFPIMYDREPTVEHVYHKYEETVELDSEDEGVYYYMAEIENFIAPDPITILGDASVKINGHDAVLDANAWLYANTDKTLYAVSFSGDDDNLVVSINSLTQLSGDALNVVVEFFWPESTEGTPVQPKTNIEKYLAYKADIYDGDLPEPKTATEYYIKTWATSKDDDGGKGGTHK